MSNIYLVLYATAWIVTFIIYQKRKQHFDAGGLILISYLFYSIVSLILYNNPDTTFGTFNRIRLFPFIYLYLMVMLAVYPILKYDDNKIKKIQKPNTVLFNAVSLIFIVASLSHLPTTISNFVTGLIKLLYSSSGGKDLYDEAMSNSYNYGNGSISNLAAIISGAFSNLGILLFFYYLTLKKQNLIILVGLFLSNIVSILTYISLGQRGLIVGVFFSMLITYFALRNFISTSINKRIKIIGTFLILIIAVPLFALTTSRFGNEAGGSVASINYYIGQENLNFNNYGLDNGGIRYGDRTFPLFKRLLGFDNVPHNFWERRQKYPNLKVNDEVFITFVGDFTLDFGPFVAPLIFILVTLFVLNNTRIRKRRILFHQLILIHFVMCVCMLGGMKLYPFSDAGGNLQLIVYFVAYVSFRVDHEMKEKRYQTFKKRSNIIVQ